MQAFAPIVYTLIGILIALIGLSVLSMRSRKEQSFGVKHWSKIENFTYHYVSKVQFPDKVQLYILSEVVLENLLKQMKKDPRFVTTVDKGSYKVDYTVHAVFTKEEE